MNETGAYALSEETQNGWRCGAGVLGMPSWEATAMGGCGKGSAVSAECPGRSRDEWPKRKVQLAANSPAFLAMVGKSLACVNQCVRVS